MHLMHLSLTNFRAFSRLDLDLPRRIILFHGANAQGKTTLLESIYYLATLTSFHTPNDRQLISLFAPQDEVIVSRIVAEKPVPSGARYWKYKDPRSSCGNNSAGAARSIKPPRTSAPTKPKSTNGFRSRAAPSDV